MDEDKIVRADPNVVEDVIASHTIDQHTCNSNDDELYYLSQIYKYTKHLEHLYNKRRVAAREGVEVDHLEQWRTFDQS